MAERDKPKKESIQPIEDYSEADASAEDIEASIELATVTECRESFQNRNVRSSQVSSRSSMKGVQGHIR